MAREASLESLLQHLSSVGVRLSADGDRIKVDAPRGALTPALRAALAEHKLALVEHLGAGPRPSDPTAVPASFAQQRMWFLDRLEASTGYHIPFALSLVGPLDLDALRASITDVVARHDALRTHFAEPTGHHRAPTLVVTEESDIELSVEPVQSVADADRQVRAFARIPFDLATGPLLRARLFRLDAQHHRLAFVVHHVVFDGWSLGIFLREWAASYRARIAGRAPALAPVSGRYRDYASRRRAQLVGPRLDRLVAYWRGHLADAPPVLDLPLDRPRPALRRDEGARLTRRVDASSMAALEALGRSQRSTLNQVLLAAFSALLGRYGQTEDVVVGHPVAHRTDRRDEGTIGLFVNTLAVRTRPETSLPFTTYLRAVGQAVAGGLAHQDLPFDRVVDALKVERSLDRNPLFQTLFSYKQAPEPIELPGLDVALEDIDHGGAVVDLTLNARRGADGVELVFEYSTAIFDRETIARFAENLSTVLREIVADPDRPLGRLSMVSPDERALLDAFSRDDMPVDSTRLVHELVADQAAARPDAPAITHRGQTITYGALIERAKRLALHLQRRGIGPGARVAIFLERSIDTLVGILATLSAGAAYIPFDPDQPARRLSMMLEDSQPAAIITVTAFVDRLGVGDRAICLDTFDTTVDTVPVTSLVSTVGPSDLAYIIYTSGSTGVPKGAMIEHRAILTSHHGYLAAYGAHGLGPGRSHLQVANPAFDVFTGDWVRALCNGGRLVICDTELLGDPTRMYALMASEQVDSADMVPVLARRLCDHLEGTGQRLDFLRCCVFCGDVLYVDDMRRVRALCGPDARVINSYGVTEAAVHNTVGEQIDTDALGDANAPIGRPMANTRAFVLDAAGRPLPIGAVGELCVGGRGVGRGYWNRPALTAEKFVELEIDGEPTRVYRAGDRARWRPDGNMEFLGRMDYQVQLRGLRIEPGEIEAALLEHPGVLDAIVMLRGAPEPMLVAWVALVEPLPALGDVLRRFLEPRIPRYMVPSAFVPLDALPITPNGKIDRRALPDPTATREGGFVQPRDGVELKLVLIWERLLQRTPVGVTDDFFALGGDSLLTVRLVSIIEQTFGVRVPLSLLFRCATIERLASALRRQDASAPWSPLVCIQPKGEATPLFFVHAAGGIVFRYIQVAAMLGETRPFYGLQARGIEPGDPLYPSIEEMAADYVKAIRAVQPEGPYLIGGWSFGGTVAFEMARVLEAQGQSVPTLIMVDAPAADVDDYAEDDVEFLLERLRPAAGLALADVGEYSTREEQLRYIFEQQRLAGLLAPDITDADAALRLAVHKHHNRIGCAYRPGGPCDTRIVFVEPSESIPFDARMKQPVPAWRPFAGRGLDVLRSAGNHFDMFSDAHSPEIAGVLRSVLDRIDPKTLILTPDTPRT